MNMNKLGVFAVNPHRIVLERVRQLVDCHMAYRMVGGATKAKDALKMIKSLKPRIVIMETSMPDMNAADVILHIRDIDPEVKIMIFTNDRSKDRMLEFLQIGVSAYILDRNSIEELVSAITAVMKGGVYICADAWKLLSNHLPCRHTSKTGSMGGH